MAKLKLTFDQIIYTVVAIPALFFASYVVSLVIAIFVLTYLHTRISNKLVAQMLDNGSALILIVVGAFVPTVFLTIRFFRAGWPDSSTKNRTDEALKSTGKIDDGIRPSCQNGTTHARNVGYFPPNGRREDSLSFSKCCKQDYLFGGGFLFPAILWVLFVLNSMGIVVRKFDWFVDQTLLNGLLICIAATVVGLISSWWRWRELAALYNHGVRVEALITVLRKNCITVEYEFDNRKYKKSLTPGDASAFANKSTTDIIVDPKRPRHLMLVE